MVTSPFLIFLWMVPAIQSEVVSMLKNKRRVEFRFSFLLRAKSTILPLKCVNLKGYRIWAGPLKFYKPHFHW